MKANNDKKAVISSEASLRKERNRENFIRYGVVVGILILVILFSVTTTTFFRTNNFMNILTAVSINAFLAIGMMMVITTCGIDLSVGSNVALSSILCALLLQHTGSVSLTLIATVLTGAFIGMINGLAVAYTSVPPFIVTLAMQTIGRGVTLIISEGFPINARNDIMNFVGRGNILGIPTSVVILVFVTAISFVVLNRTKIGRYIYAIGGNIETTRLSGIKVGRYITFAYIYIGIMAGIVAFIMTGRLASATPTIGVGWELDAVAAAVLGGTAFTGGVGTVGGALLGALFIGILNNGMTLLGISPFVQNVLKGLVIFGAVLISVQSSKRRK